MPQGRSKCFGAALVVSGTNGWRGAAAGPAPGRLDPRSSTALASPVRISRYDLGNGRGDVQRLADDGQLERSGAECGADSVDPCHGAGARRWKYHSTVDV